MTISTKLLTTAFVLTCAFQAHAVSSETEASSKALGANMTEEISFDEGKATLTDSAKKEISQFVKTAKDKGKIHEMKIAVWADREYPSKDTKASPADVKLADERAKALKEYMKKELAVSNVNTYNMTKRPNEMQKFLQTQTATTKETMEKMGAAPSTSKDTGMFKQRAQSSKAVMMIYME
ncbi:MAG: hypothetical protein J7501_09205 [Bdellovibrio sp.]|nr:hypothetical protein [Bdellovibrio sp.]